MENFKVGQLYSESFNGMPAKEIIDNLEGQAYKMEERDYTHALSDQEVAQRERELGRVSIEIKKIEDEKKEMVDEFKQRLKVPNDSKEALLDAIKFRSERKFGKLYLIDDQDSGNMYSFDENGVCVDVRPLTPQEKQTIIRSLNFAQDGTHQ